MSRSSQVFALIPAGGKSQRMGRPKLLLPLGQKTVLEWVIDAFPAAGIQQVVVVVPAEDTPLQSTAQSAGASVCLLAEPTPEMRATIEEGLRWAEEHFRPDAESAWLLSPADHPMLDSQVIQLLTAAWQQETDHTIFIPTFQGKRGHPALIAWSHVPGLRAYDKAKGLNSYLREHADQTQEIEVTSKDIFVDLDTPEDYKRLLDRWNQDKRA